MERHGYLGRRQLQPSPTPPDAHVNYQNAVRNGPFQQKGGIHGNQSRDNNFGGDRKDRFPYQRFDSKERYGRDSSPMSQRSMSPTRNRRLRESLSPNRDRFDSRNKRRLSASGSPAGGPTSYEPPMKREKKKKKKKSKDEEFDVNGKSKSQLKREKKERKKAEKAKKKALKKEKKMKKLRDLEEKRMSIEMRVQKEEKTTNDDKKVGNKVVDKNGDATKDANNVSENDGISDISQVTEPNEIASEVSEGEPLDTTVNTEKPNTTSTTTTTTTGLDAPAADTDTAVSDIPPEEKPAVTENTKQEGEISGDESGDGVVCDEKPPDVKKQQQQPSPDSPADDDSSDSSSSSSSSSDSDDDSDDTSDDEHPSSRKSKHTYSSSNSKARNGNSTKDDRDPSREPKAYRQDSDHSRHSSERERGREYSRSSKYSDYYRNSSSNNKDRRDGSYDRRDDCSPAARGSPRYGRGDTRSERSQKTSSSSSPVRSSSTQSNNNNSGASRSTDTLLDLLRRFPVMWQGLLGLKNDTAAVQMHFLSGRLSSFQCICFYY